MNSRDSWVCNCVLGCVLPAHNHVFLSDLDQMLKLGKEAIQLFPKLRKDIMPALVTVNLCIWRSWILLSLCPTKGRYYLCFTDEETMVKLLAHDMKSHEPVIASWLVPESSNVLFHLQPCFWLPQARRASSGSVCTKGGAAV